MTSSCRLPTGQHLPKGTVISFLGRPAQVDPELLEDAAKFDPFRFSRMREMAQSRNENIPAVSLVTTSAEFLLFGHGKHACPGRFLVEFELKMILAYVLQNYHLTFPPDYEEKRPANIWLAEAVMPPPGARIRVKRRAMA